MANQISNRRSIQFEKEMNLRLVRETLALSRARCKSVSSLIDQVKNLVNECDPLLVVMALEEKDISNQQRRSLAKAIQILIRDVDLTPHINKAAFDRRVARLLRILPIELSGRMVVNCVSHHRKSMRSAGLKSLYVNSLDENLYGHLVKCFENTGDLWIVKALLRHPLRLDYMSPDQALELFSDDNYWQMRVIEACLKAEQEMALPYVVSHAYAFAWAAGRYGDKKLVPQVLQCLDSVSDRSTLMGIVIWALGKLSASAELLLIEKELSAI